MKQNKLKKKEKQKNKKLFQDDQTPGLSRFITLEFLCKLINVYTYVYTYTL